MDASKRSKNGASVPKFLASSMLTAVRCQRERCSQTRSEPLRRRELGITAEDAIPPNADGPTDVNLRDKAARGAHERTGVRDFRVGGD